MDPTAALLPECLAQFVMVADSHLVDEQAAHAAEFASRSQQNARVERALAMATRLGCPVFHLGDLVQDYPDSPLHERLLTEAVEQWRAAAHDVCFVPGNADVGDPVEPSSPAPPVTHRTMQRFESVAGHRWGILDVGPVRVIGLASSLFNSGLDMEEEQWQWLHDEITAAAGKRVVLAFHHAMFLTSWDDPGVGNYDVINEPARSRLLSLVRDQNIEAVFTGHSHTAFFNRIERTRLYGAPSTSFTRPGFSESFSSSAPADRGRNDAAKLGMLLVRVHSDGIRVHRVRTAGAAGSAPADQGTTVISCTPSDLRSSPLGVVLRHPLAAFTEVPDVFPSIVRQPVRNDHPLLSCIDLGVRSVSVPISDMLNREQAERLDILRDEGVAINTRVIWPRGEELQVPDTRAIPDVLEIVLLDRATLTASEASVLHVLGESHRVRLSTMVRNQSGTAELPRWRYGFTVGEVAELREMAEDLDRLRLLVHLSDNDDVETVARSMATVSKQRLTNIDVVVPAGADAQKAPHRLTKSFITMCKLGIAHFFVDGLTELDRTLDLSAGLIDRASNPQPAFHALRVLNSLIFSGEPAEISDTSGGFHIERQHLRADVVFDEHVPNDAPATINGCAIIDLSTGETVVEHGSAGGPWMRLYGGIAG